MCKIRVRFADPAKDAPKILEIYRPYIEHTPVTFEIDVPTAQEFMRRVQEIAAQFPYLLLEEDGEVIGYAYAHRQAERAAFRFNAELSIYLREEHTGRGLGVPLYSLLMRLLAMQRYVNFYAVITGSNAGSIAMHERMGFERIGVHRHTGYKFGRWHDTVWLVRRVHDGEPGEILPAGALDAQAVAQEIAKTEASLKEKMKEKLRVSSKKP